jgi:hypothetical protein
MFMRKMLLNSLMLAAVFALFSCTASELPSKVSISKDELMDKVKGAWAGQTIGCTYGGPTEFRYNGTMIADSIEIGWPEGCVKWYYDNGPGLYDDVYMDLTFVNVFAKEGLDAPISSFEKAFAYAGYPLWHANQQARYNIRNGMTSPESGFWMNNPHADDIDFQIEADYAGIMSPGMVNAAAYYCDGIGHMMNYGDGWYGGVYVAAMYALAFVCDDIEFIVEEALKVIPQQSRYYRCMKDVIDWHKAHPDDWKSAWQMCSERHDLDIGCPEGVHRAFNIDAVINSAYILIGLLYGDGDFGRTMDISTRCGFDSDCNPASAAGILGTILGYSGIPQEWMNNLREVEDMDFAYTDISLNDAYRMSFEQALQVIEKNGGKVADETVTIRCSKPEPVRFEQSFPGLRPKPLLYVGKDIRDVGKIEFEGKGVVVRHWYSAGTDSPDAGDYAAEIDVFIDGRKVETVLLPMTEQDRRLQLFYKYDLDEGPHEMTFHWRNPSPEKSLHIHSCIVYGTTIQST